MHEGRGDELCLVERFFAGTGPTYDQVVHYATLGIDGRWKRRILAAIPPGATRILDLASGTGILTFALARHFPSAEVVGVELREEYVSLARAKHTAAGLHNVSFVQGRAEDFTTDRPFDCVVSSYLAKYAELPRLAEAARAWLKPGGMFVAHDFTLPPSRSLLAIWTAYFWLLQRMVGPWLPAWCEIFYGLPQLIQRTRWCEELPEELRKRGFQEIQLQSLTLYGSALLTATRPLPANGRVTKPGPTG